MSIFKKLKKIILGEKDAEEIAGSLHDFNDIAESYIGILKQDVKQKEEKLNKIRVLVRGDLPKDYLKKERGSVNVTVLSKKEFKKSKQSNVTSSSESKWSDIENTYNKKTGKSKGFRGGII